MTPTATANSKHSLTLSLINIQPHTNGLFTSVPFTLIEDAQLSTTIEKNEKREKLAKKQSTPSEETEQASEPDSDMADFGINQPGS